MLVLSVLPTWRELPDARRGVQAGFDMMEISGIVGYLISNFLSAYYNRRTDEYGGDVYGRCKFMNDIIKGDQQVIDMGRRRRPDARNRHRMHPR